MNECRKMIIQKYTVEAEGEGVRL